MNAVSTISLLSYLILFIVCGRFVTSSESEDGSVDATFGETLFLSLFGLDDTPPCKLCGNDENAEDTTQLYLSFNRSNIFWWKNGQLLGSVFKQNNFFSFIFNKMDAINIWISSQKIWIKQRLGSRTCCGICFLLAIVVLSTFITVVRKRSSKVFKDKGLNNVRHSKRRKTATSIPTTYHYTQTPYFKKEQGNSVTKINKRKLKRMKEHKAIQTMMKLKHSTSEEEKYSHQLGLQCLGLKSADFDRKLFRIKTECHGPVSLVTDDVIGQKQTTKPFLDTHEQRNPTASASFPTAQESDGLGSDLNDESFDLLACSELDLSRDIGQPCASSSVIGLGGASILDDTSTMDISSSSGNNIQRFIPKTVVRWCRRINWPKWRQYRHYVEMPWIHSFTENSLLDLSLHQDSFDISNVQETLHMNGLDCTSVYQLVALFAMKTGYDKLKNRLYQNKSQNCSDTMDLLNSSDESSEV